jgi:hypothetical protein
MGSRSDGPLDGQLSLFAESSKTRRRRRPLRGSSYPPGYFDNTIAVLDAILAQRKGLKPFEGRCVGCGKVISAKARTCGRRTCPAVYPTWKRDQRAVVREALKEYGGLLLLTDVTLPGTPEQEHTRRNVAIPWASAGRRRGDPKALHKANRRFKARLRWIKRKAYNAGRSALLKSGLPYEHLPPVLVGNLELQKRGALHAHLALPYTSPQERIFARAFIDCMKEWAPRCGLGFVQGWQAAERRSLLGHERAAGYLTKYLTSKHPPEFLRALKGPVVTVSRQLTRRTGCTIQMLRKTRRLWATRQGHCPAPDWDWETAIRVGFLLERRSLPPRAP